MLGAVRSPVEETLGDSAAGLGVALRVVGDGEGGDGGAASGTRAPRHQAVPALFDIAPPAWALGLSRMVAWNRSLDLAPDVLGRVLHAVGHGEGAVEPASAWMVMVDPEAVALLPAEVAGSPMMVRGPRSASGFGRVLGDVDGLGFPRP